MKKTFIFMISLLFILAACAPDVDVNSPPEILYGEDTCDRCRMIISEERYAAAYYTQGGELRKFDDVGGMFRYPAEVEDQVATFWVHDYDSLEWIRAEGAFFVFNDALHTPMGFGIVAFEERSRAEAFAEENGGEVMGFKEAMDKVQGAEMKMDMGE